MKFLMFPLASLFLAACGNQASPAIKSVSDTCTSTVRYVIEGLAETESPNDLPSIEQFEASCSCAAKSVVQSLDADAYESFAENFDEAVDAYIEVIESITLYGAGDPARMAAGISEANTPARAAAAFGFWNAFEPCLEKNGIDVSGLLPNSPALGSNPNVASSESAEPRLDDRQEAACIEILTGDDRPEIVSAHSEADIEKACGTHAFLLYHHYSAGSSERGKRDMTHEVEVLEAAIDVPRENWSQYQSETIENLAAFVDNAVKDLDDK